ncbi:MAG TPA: CoA transferase [Burkholderiales bacterium]|nr:CoA transferase [Burkholderiales bacterium]
MASKQPLHGYTVVEIGHSVAAPYAGMILADLGADVIKIEHPEGGDYARGWGPPFWNEAAPHFVAMNRNKRGVTVDLADEAQTAALRKLIVEEADAVVCNLRPGTAERRGLGPQALLASKPELVYCEIGAFGRGGPLSDRPGYDPLMQAYGGLMSITGESVDRPPIRVGVSMIDMGTGLWAAMGIMGALLEREKTGRGGLVETSLYETAIGWVAIPIARVNIEPAPQLPQGSGAPGIVPYQAFRTRDGWLVIGAGNDTLFAKLAQAFDVPDLARDERYRTNRARVANRATLIPLLEEKAAQHGSAELAALLDRHGVPNAPVQKIEQVIADAQTQALGIVQQGPHGALPTVGLPLRFDGERPGYERAAPALGEHNDEVMARLRTPKP